MYLFEDNRSQPLFPDFCLNDMVLDAKYKDEEKNGVRREDYHQMITYQYILNGRKGGFVSPSEIAKARRLGRLNGYGSELFIFHVGIPKGCTSYSAFCQQMEIEEEIVCEKLGKIK